MSACFCLSDCLVASQMNAVPRKLKYSQQCLYLMNFQPWMILVMESEQHLQGVLLVPSSEALVRVASSHSVQYQQLAWGLWQVLLPQQNLQLHLRLSEQAAASVRDPESTGLHLLQHHLRLALTLLHLLVLCWFAEIQVM